MVLFNYSTRELTAKIVYYGPGLCGKTTNLQYVHGTLPENVKGKMLSLATKTDRTLFFDFLPIDLGEIRGMKTRIQLYTVPGQVFYNETRKLVLKGADGIVFVADSQAAMLGANVESFRNLEENLKAHGMKLAEMPHVLQFNKRDLPKLSTIEELNGGVNRYNAPFYESVATTGIGVQDTLKAITKLVLLHLTRKYDPKAAPAAEPRPPQPRVAATPPPPAPPPPASAQTVRLTTSDIGQRAPAGRSIPLSNVADPFSQGSERGRSAGERTGPRHDAEPVFAEQEIEALVNEVQESEDLVDFDSPEPTVTASNDASTRSLEAPSAVRVAAGPRPAGGGDSPAPPTADLFEIDHGVDPEWTPREDAWDVDGAAGSAPASAGFAAPSVSDPVWDLGAPAAESMPIEASSSLADRPAEPRLTELVRDRDLFEDPGVEVAHIAAGSEREIVIPVEVAAAEGTAQRRRFKLTVRLRLDPVD